MSDPWKLLTDRETKELIASLPPEWASGSEDENIESIARRLENSDCVDEKFLEILAYSSYWKIRRAVALSPSCSSAFVERLKLKKVKDHWGVNPDEVILQAIRDRSLPPEWRVEDTDLLIEKIKSGAAPRTVLEALAKHDYPSVVEAVVRAPGVTQEILGQIHQRCMDAEPAFRFADVLAALSELTNTGSIQSQPPVDDSQEIGSEELIGSLEPEQLELLFNALAVAGIEDVVSRDQSEVWTLLGEDEPDDYDYNTDSHSEIIERATGTLAQDLDEAYQISYESFDSKIQENRGYWKFWQRLSGEEFGRDIDSFSEALDRVLEDIS